jgi:ribosomal protein L11 methyltransferase
MNEYYYELIVKPEVYYELFLELINSIVNDAIEELNGSIIIRSENKLDDVKEGVEAFKQELTNAFNTSIECKIILKKKKNQDWIKIYQKSIKPIEVGDFYIYPSWEKPKKNKQNILLDPALSFGSGHHESTNSCLLLINKYVKANNSVADIGCGSGILGIACAKLKAKVDICDIDALAVENAKKNFKINNASLNNSWIGSACDSNLTYDLVIANIIAGVLIAIKNDLQKITKNNGIIILSGIINTYQDEVINTFEDFQILEIIKQNEWITLVLKRIKQ